MQPAGLAKLLIRMAWQVSYSCIFLIRSRDEEDYEARETKNFQTFVENEIENRTSYISNLKIVQTLQKYELINICAHRVLIFNILMNIRHFLIIIKVAAINSFLTLIITISIIKQ